MLPLTTADLLAMTIVGSVLENMDMERLITGKLREARTESVGSSKLTQIRDRVRGRTAYQAKGRIDAERRGGCSVSFETHSIQVES